MSEAPAIFNAGTLDSIIQLFGLVAVALITALTATRREGRQAQLQRHFAFSDERSRMYADFTRQVGKTWALWWDAAGLVDNKDIVDSQSAALAKKEALELDVQMGILRISVPRSVENACGQVNGMLQIMVTELEFNGASSIDWHELEKAKAAMTEKMRADIHQIGEARDRRQYLKKVAKK